MADDEYTPEQLSKIARHFVYVMPHGEAHEVIKDLKKIVKPSSIIDDKWVENALGEYHKKRFDIISGDTSKVICCPQGEVNTAPPQFLNPDKKVVCYIDTTNSVSNYLHSLHPQKSTIHFVRFYSNFIMIRYDRKIAKNSS